MNNSLKSKVKLWVSFLRLAHQSQDPEIQKNLNNNQSFYSDWGNYQSGSFDNWWKFHSYLFKEQSKLKVLMAGDVVEDGMFTIQFPFAYAPTTASKIFKDMFQRAFEAQRTDKKKVKKVYGGSFELKPDDFQVSHFEYYLKFCKEVYLPLMSSAKKPQTKEFVNLAKERFKEKTKRTSSRRIPFTNSTLTDESARRLAMRYRTYSHNLMMNASNGEFPGAYEEMSIKNQVEKRKTEYPVRKYSKGVPRSKNEIYKKRESGFDMFATRKNST